MDSWQGKAHGETNYVGSDPDHIRLGTKLVGHERAASSGMRQRFGSGDWASEWAASRIRQK